MPNTSIKLQYGTRHSVTACLTVHTAVPLFPLIKKAMVTVCYCMLVFLYTP